MTCRVDDLDFGVRLTWNIGFLVFFFFFFEIFFPSVLLFWVALTFSDQYK